MKIRVLPLFLIGVFCALNCGCYSFKGVSIDPNVDTFYVDDFQLSAPNAPITLNSDFSEALRDKIRRETRLGLTEVDPDLEFSGEITSYQVTALDPQPGEFTALNRLTIRVKVNFLSNYNNDNQWEETFSFFADFSSDDILTNVQDDLIKTIFDQITEDVFNRAFSNW